MSGFIETVVMLTNRSATIRPNVISIKMPVNAGTQTLTYRDLQPVLERRCYPCHGEQVQMKGVRLDSAKHVKAYAQYMYQQAVVLKLMPMNNATGITEDERLMIKRWFEAGAATD